MSVKNEIDRIKANIAAAYTQVEEMGGTLPGVRDSAHLPGAVGTIPMGVDTSDATATAEDIAPGKTAYVKGVKVTGSMKEPPIPDINPSTPDFLVMGGYDAAWNTILAACGPTKDNYALLKNTGITIKLPSGFTQLAEQTIVPGTANKTIAANQYLTGVQTIKGDANLKPENIKKGVNIFGVIGTYEG